MKRAVGMCIEAITMLISKDDENETRMTNLENELEKQKKKIKKLEKQIKKCSVHETKE